MRTFISLDKRSVARRLSGVLLALAALVGPSSAAADLIGPDEEVCVKKQAGDACSDAQGAAGTCVAYEALGGRQRLRCVAGAKAPAAQPAAATTPGPQPSAATTPAPQPSAAAATVAEKKGCSVSAAGSSNDVAPLGITVALAALAFSRAKRRARPAG
ncbi:hypothetical protein [Polyangium sp. 6x1]|uniref:hypothetical protein n=1 Tax=Polyangium sp. 6x1 TaxID=3042689 RepID=UPI002482C7B9|nr:hypothetical protein [Polyangium sp. 6x1]MDI1446130.1 hypothetical protein [Polyangium sp. 6x1]